MPRKAKKRRSSILKDNNEQTRDVGNLTLPLARKRVSWAPDNVRFFEVEKPAEESQENDDENNHAKTSYMKRMPHYSGGSSSFTLPTHSLDDKDSQENQESKDIVDMNTTCIAETTEVDNSDSKLIKKEPSSMGYNLRRRSTDAGSSNETMNQSQLMDITLMSAVSEEDSNPQLMDVTCMSSVNEEDISSDGTKLTHDNTIIDKLDESCALFDDSVLTSEPESLLLVKTTSVEHSAKVKQPPGELSNTKSSVKALSVAESPEESKRLSLKQGDKTSYSQRTMEETNLDLTTESCNSLGRNSSELDFLQQVVGSTPSPKVQPDKHDSFLLQLDNSPKATKPTNKTNLSENLSMHVEAVDCGQASVGLLPVVKEKRVQPLPSVERKVDMSQVEKPLTKSQPNDEFEVVEKPNIEPLPEIAVEPHVEPLLKIEEPQNEILTEVEKSHVEPFSIVKKPDVESMSFIDESQIKPVTQEEHEPLFNVAQPLTDVSSPIKVPHMEPLTCVAESQSKPLPVVEKPLSKSMSAIEEPHRESMPVVEKPRFKPSLSMAELCVEPIPAAENENDEKFSKEIMKISAETTREDVNMPATNLSIAEPHMDVSSPVKVPHVEMLTSAAESHSKPLPVVEKPHSESMSVIEKPHSESMSVVEKPHSESMSVIEKPHSESMPVVEKPHSESMSVIERSRSESMYVVKEPHSESMSVVEELKLSPSMGQLCVAPIPPHGNEKDEQYKEQSVDISVDTTRKSVNISAANLSCLSNFDLSCSKFNEDRSQEVVTHDNVTNKKIDLEEASPELASIASKFEKVSIEEFVLELKEAGVLGDKEVESYVRDQHEKIVESIEKLREQLKINNGKEELINKCKCDIKTCARNLMEKVQAAHKKKRVEEADKRITAIRTELDEILPDPQATIDCILQSINKERQHIKEGVQSLLGGAVPTKQQLDEAMKIVTVIEKNNKKNSEWHAAIKENRTKVKERLLELLKRSKQFKTMSENEEKLKKDVYMKHQQKKYQLGEIIKQTSTEWKYSYMNRSLIFSALFDEDNTVKSYQLDSFLDNNSWIAECDIQLYKLIHEIIKHQTDLSVPSYPLSFREKMLVSNQLELNVSRGMTMKKCLLQSKFKDYAGKIKLKWTKEGVEIVCRGENYCLKLNMEFTFIERRSDGVIERANFLPLSFRFIENNTSISEQDIKKLIDETSNSSEHTNPMLFKNLILQKLYQMCVS